MIGAFPSARAPLGLTAGLALLALGCSDSHVDSRQLEPAGSPADGSLVWSVAAPLMSSPVAAVRFSVTCDNGHTSEVTAPLESEALPPWIESEGGAFADGFTVVPPGECTVVATAIDAQGEPIADCAEASATVVIAPGETTEVVLPMMCLGEDVAALDAVGVLNHAPQCDELVIEPGGAILICEGVMVQVSLFDPEDDVISSVSWAVSDAPVGSSYYLEADGSQLLFSADDPGIYWIELTATDEWGATSTTVFPVPVSLSLDPAQCGPDALCVDSLCVDGDPCTVDSCDAGICENTGLEEVCDGVDNDCDGSADEDCMCPVTGDVTGAATVTVADVVCLILTTLWSVTGEVGPPPGCLGANDPSVADINCDSAVGVPDIQLAIHIALGNPLPVTVDPNGNGCSDSCEPDPCGNGVCEPEESDLDCPLDCP